MLPRRVAVFSVHTSPLDQPGAGDAGGLNVYVAETARRLARRGIAVEVLTRATSASQPPSVPLDDGIDGVVVQHVVAGPYEGLDKADLPAQLCAFSAAVLRAAAAREPGWYGLVHSHYWLSGQVGWLARDRWGVPLVHSAHTLGRVKNAALADGDAPEPAVRLIGEDQVVAEADRLVAATRDEARELIELYSADPGKVSVVPPGVDLETFAPGDRRAERRRLGIPLDAAHLLFVGRLQPLKAPDVLVRAAAELRRDPRLAGRRLVVSVLGAPSGSGLADPDALGRLARELGVDDVVRVHAPVDRPTLAAWYRSADLTVVPSYSESFGLVALESQACGTPVVAASVGGLTTAVADGVSGVLVSGHSAHDWAAVLAGLLTEPGRLRALADAAPAQARQFSWDVTVDGLLAVYGEAMAARRAESAAS